MALETPRYSLDEYPNVYEPREDTFSLLDALELEIDYLKGKRPTFALEIGSGSGVVITSLYSIFKEQCLYFATDVNPEACLATQNTAKLNKTNVEILNTNLSNGLKCSMFDLILFNPPYVVTDSEEYNGKIINKAWAGGCRGREIIDRFLKELPKMISSHGTCYLLLLRENDPGEVTDILSKLGFKCNIILDRKIIGEHLFVMKIIPDLDQISYK